MLNTKILQKIETVINLCYSIQAKNRAWRIEHELYPILNKFDIFIAISFN